MRWSTAFVFVGLGLTFAFHAWSIRRTPALRTGPIEDGTLVEGTVVDERGAPVEGAFAWAVFGSPNPILDVGRSDKEGRFHIHLYSVGDRVLVAHADGRGALFQGGPEVPKGTRDAGAPVPIGRVILRVVPPITGKVVDAEGHPLPGVVVDGRPEGTWILGLEVTSGDAILRHPPSLATTGADGCFTLAATIPLPYWVGIPSLEGGRLGVRHDIEGMPKQLIEVGVIAGVPGGAPITFRVLRPDTLAFAVVDAETAEPVRRVTIGFPRGMPEWSPTSGDQMFTSVTTGDSEFVLAEKWIQPLTVGGVGYRTRSVEDLRALPRDKYGRHVVGLDADKDAAMLRLRWDRALEALPWGVQVWVRDRGMPPPRDSEDGVDHLRPYPSGGAADLMPPEKGPLRWLLDAPGRVLVGGTWDGKAADRRNLQPPEEARIEIRMKDGAARLTRQVALRDADGHGIPYRYSELLQAYASPIFYVHDPETGDEFVAFHGIARHALLGGLPAGRVTLVVMDGGKRHELPVELAAGKTTTVELP